ncbi:MAG: hypothetical protein HQK99_15900 [Nitrospirae bacterium]|nr:hypothetical protein [Nitrospirota bacterium]
MNEKDTTPEIKIPQPVADASAPDTIFISLDKRLNKVRENFWSWPHKGLYLSVFSIYSSLVIGYALSKCETNQSIGLLSSVTVGIIGVIIGIYLAIHELKKKAVEIKSQTTSIKDKIEHMHRMLTASTHFPIYGEMQRECKQIICRSLRNERGTTIHIIGLTLTKSRAFIQEILNNCCGGECCSTTIIFPVNDNYNSLLLYHSGASF